MPRRVLVPLDRSHRSEAALAQLPEVCSPSDEITLISVGAPGEREHIAALPPSNAIRYGGVVGINIGRETPVFETPKQARERQLAELSSYLGDKADELLSRGFDVQIQPIVAKNPASAIIKFARDHKPSLIVLVRRTHDPRRLIFGSVAGAIARSDVAPVLLLPARPRR